MSSSSSVVEISRSKRRYHDQDCLLQAFVSHPGFTAKEIAVEVLDWKYEQYANAPKRAFDLQKLGYLDQLEGRECRQTGKTAHTYSITEKGVEHLKKAGLSVGVVYHIAPPPAVTVAVESARRHLDGIKSLLGGDYA